MEGFGMTAQEAAATKVPVIASNLVPFAKEELAPVADGWRDAIGVILWVMAKIDRETAYNVITHNGPGAGLYFEFLPYTQETGGFEHLGLYICQANPGDTASQLKEFLNEHRTT
jgi:hypothetical protein